ncbi:MAG TPA: L-threonylcarbamoyladenylate synthase [Candidatus Deferrimicrobium sp.]|nr:L-threonylcarbamoyladenylate synthase [Candidatus Deferrimicrobium sp.]
MVQILTINPDNPDPTVIRKARTDILEGKLVIFPTDTVYGLAADPFNEKAVTALITAKKRDSTKGFPILVANLEIAKELVFFSSIASSIASKFWPGALTLILPLKKSVSNLVTGYRQTLGIRIPNHSIAQQLAEIPIIGTSANISGKKSPITAEDAISQLGNSVDLVLNGGSTKGDIPSTIIDLSEEPPKLLREGAIKWDQLRPFLF